MLRYLGWLLLFVVAGVITAAVISYAVAGQPAVDAAVSAAKG